MPPLFLGRSSKGILKYAIVKKVRDFQGSEKENSYFCRRDI